MDVAGDLAPVDAHVEALALEPAQRHDDGGGAAGEDLGDRPGGDVGQQALQADRVLHDLAPGVGQERDDGAAGRALQDRARQARGAHGAVGAHDHDVHAAELLEIGLGHVVEEADLLAALRGGLLLGQERGGVVAARLGSARAAAPGAVVLPGDPDADGLQAVGEVGAARGGDDVVLDGVGGVHPQEGLRGEGVGAQVERLALAVGHPGLVGAHEVDQGGDEVLLGQLGQGQAAGRGGQPGRVVAGAEGPHAAVVVAVGLDALEDLLPVVQDGGGRGQAQVAEGDDAALAPAPVARPAGVGHVVGEDGAEVEVPQRPGAGGVVGGARVGGQGEAAGQGVGGRDRDCGGAGEGRGNGAGCGRGGRSRGHGPTLPPRSVAGRR